MKILKFIPKNFIRDQFVRRAKLGKDFEDQIKKNVNFLSNAVEVATMIYEKLENNNILFYDLILLQIKLLYQINFIAYNLYLSAFNPKNKSFITKAIEMVKEHTETRLKGDKNQKWATWYDPIKTRPNGGYPSIKKLKKLV